MTELRAEVDARAPAGELPATSVVGGIPLIVRPLRQLARLGFRAAHVVVDDAGAAERIRGALARHPIPSSLAVELGAGAAAAPTLVLDGRAIYRAADLAAAAAAGTSAADDAADGPRSPRPLLRVRTPGDAAAAERALYHQIRKSVDADGVFAHHIIRPLTRPLSRALLATPVTPNQVTAAALACAVGAALLLAAGGLGRAALAGALYFAGNALDCIDGDLARLRLQSSKLGEWLDSMTDEIATFSVLAGLGVGLWRDGAGAAWLWIGPGGAAIGALAVACLYVDLHRMRLPIDTAQFPWFFARPPGAGPAAEKRTPLGTALYGLGFLIRRDANVTGVTIMLLAGWRELAAALVAAGAVAGALVTATHYAVTAARRTRS